MQTKNADRENLPTVPMSAKERRIVYCVAIAAFTFQFEAFLIQVALPTMARELYASSTEISFVILTYLLATTVALVPAGKLGDRFGLRRTFLAGCAVAAIATLLLGLSTHVWMLWVCRFLQGLGIGSMVAAAYAMIPAWVGKGNTGRGYGMLSMGASIGMVVGLPVGGILSQALSWQWIFLITTPVFIGLFYFAWKVLPSDNSPNRTHMKISCAGLVFLGLMLTCAVLVLSLGGELGWTSTATLSLLFLTLLFAGFLYALRNSRHALFPSEIFRISGFVPGLCVLFIFSAAVTGIRFLIPFYLQLNCGLTALMSSILLIAYPISLAPAGVWAGKVADQTGSRALVIRACLIAAACCGVYALFLNSLGLWFSILFILGLGLATGLFYPPNNRYCMSDVPDALKAQAGSLMPVSLNMGSLIGVSLFETVFAIHAPDGVMMVSTLTQASEPMLHTLNHSFTDAIELAVLLFSGSGLIAYMRYRSIARVKAR